MPFVVLLYAFAIFFAVHAVRSGRPMYWLFILFVFPGLGSLVYFLTQVLPELRHSRGARRAAGAVVRLVDPDREMREAQEAFERTPTVDHRFRLAQALLAAGREDEALSHFEACVAGPYARDIKLRRGLARAQLVTGRHAAAADTLERLFADAPEEARGEASLWLAQALSKVDEARALAAYERAGELHATLETHAAHGLYLASLGRTEAARAMLVRALDDARLGTPHSREMNREAIEQARAALRQLGDAPAA